MTARSASSRVRRHHAPTKYKTKEELTSKLPQHTLSEAILYLFLSSSIQLSLVDLSLIQCSFIAFQHHLVLLSFLSLVLYQAQVALFCLLYTLTHSLPLRISRKRQSFHHEVFLYDHNSRRSWAGPSHPGSASQPPRRPPLASARAPWKC